MWRDKIQIYQKCGNRFQKPAKTNSVSVGTGSVLSTLITLNTKLRLPLWMALVQDIPLTTKKYVCTVKDLKTTSKSIKLDLY